MITFMVWDRMSARNLRGQASDRAEVYAPKPTGGSLMAGFSVGLIALGAIYGVLRFYNHRLAEFPVVVSAIVLASTLIGFASYKRAARKHRRAVERELACSGSGPADPKYPG